MSIGHTLLVLVVYVLACARLTRLVNADTIFDPIRVWVTGRIKLAEDHETAEYRSQRARDAATTSKRRWTALSYQLGCPWCIGFWICLACAYLPVHLVGWPWWAVFPLGLAASHLVGVAAVLADTEDIEVTDG